MDKSLLDRLVCPQSRAPLLLSPKGDELWCKSSGLAYPITDGIPVLLIDEARALTLDEKESL